MPRRTDRGEGALASLLQARDEGGVRILVLDNAPLNALTAALRGALWDALDAAEADGARGVVIGAAGATFSAGGDLKEVGRPEAPGVVPLARLNDRIEGFAAPIAVAIQGRAYGGGVLLAVAAHARIGGQAARLMLPEVRLGFVPGAGGTQRLPRLVGIPAALEMVALAQELSAERALSCGLLEAVAQDDPLPLAVAIVQEIADGKRPWRRTRNLPVPDAPEPPGLRAQVAAAFPGRDAPAEAIALISGAAAWRFEDGVARERDAFARLAAGPQAQALLHLFFAERALRPPEGVPGGPGACALLRHDGTRVAELLAAANADADALAALRAEAKRDRLLAVPVVAPVVARLRIAMQAEDALAACRDAARSCLAEGLAAAGALDILAVEACGYPAHLGGPLHHAAALDKERP
jgi:3-hydroxyacyl-CoA dehydrogenase